jgi:hypothetical protein
LKRNKNHFIFVVLFTGEVPQMATISARYKNELITALAWDLHKSMKCSTWRLNEKKKLEWDGLSTVVKFKYVSIKSVKVKVMAKIGQTVTVR